jgi:hypothetical protein
MVRQSLRSDWELHQERDMRFLDLQAKQHRRHRNWSGPAELRTFSVSNNGTPDGINCIIVSSTRETRKCV